MNTENTSQEGATDIKVEKESDDEVEIELKLYADHEIKQELVIGPEVLQRVVNDETDCLEDVPVAEKIKLEEKDEKTDQVKPKKEVIEYNTEEIISNTDIKNTTTVKNEEQSLRKYNQTPGVTCNDCGQKFRKIFELAQHMPSHEKIKQDNNYKCKECTYQTGSQVSLEQHYKLHDIDRIFASDGTKHSLLNNHPKKKVYSCSQCEYVTSIKYYIEQHLRNHTGEKPYSCPKCEYKGASKMYLKRHFHIHMKKKRFSCSKCKYECSDQSDMARHLRIHRKKNLSCSECKYKCCFKYEMAIHLRTHSGDKPYSCSYCEYKCARKPYLKIHLRTVHTDQQ